MRAACLAVAAVAGFASVMAQEPGPTFRTGVREVVLDLIVRDARGRQVKDLKPSEVEIYEDGVPQTVRGFRLVAGREAHAAQRAPARPVNALSAVNLICLVFHNILGNPDLWRNALDGAQEFLANSLQPGAYAGVFRLDAGLVTLHGFTDNRDELLQAARNGFAAPAVNFAKTAAEVSSAVAGSYASSPQPTQQASPAVRGGIAAMRGFIFDNPRPQLDQLKVMIRQLEPLPGRKTVVLFTRGVLNPTQPEWLDAVADQANRAHVTFYAVDLTAQSMYAADEPPRPYELPRYRDPDVVHRNADPEAALRTITGATGGALFATRDYRKSFQRVFEDVDTHYEATYQPSSDRLDAHLRKIEVRTSRRGMTIESRTGYFAVPDAAGSAPAAFETPAYAALTAESRSRVFDFRSVALRFRSEGASSEYVVAFAVPGSAFTATPLPQARERVHYSLLALVKDGGGQVVAKISRDFPGELNDAQLAALRANGVAYAAPIKVAPGHYSVETAVVDHEGGRSSTGTFDFTSAPNAGLSMSDPVLVQRIEPGAPQPEVNDPLQLPKGRIVPWLDSTVSSNKSPMIYFVVYADKADAGKPKLSLKVLVDGKASIDQSQDLPAPDSTGAIPMLISVPPDSGAFEIRIIARQGAQSVERALKYTMARGQ